MFVNHVHLLPAATREDATPDAFLRMADTLGIEGAVCFAPFTTQLPASIENQNQWLANELSSRPHLVGYGTLDPEKPPRDQIKEIVDLGFRGIKLHGPAQKFHLFGDWAREAYGLMAEAGLVADFHLGVHWHRLQEYDPLLSDEIAQENPELRMVFEHVGGWAWYRQVLAVVVNNSRQGNHLYGGIASVLDMENQKFWYLGPEGVSDCRWQIGADRLIYGLDFPYNQQPHIERDLEIIHKLDWPAEDIDLLLGGNLRNLLGLP